MVVSTSKLQDLEARVSALEAKRFASKGGPTVEVDEALRRARKDVENKHCYSAVWKVVPTPYYTWSLSQRADYLGASSIHHLCKSLLMENKKASATSTTPDSKDNPKYILVIVQYAATLDVKKLTRAIRSLRPVKERLDESQFDFRIASTEDNDRLTGYQHNSVTPFGLASPSSVCMVLSQAVADLGFFWMGGGHVHVKLAMTTKDFCQALSPIVADISEPRTLTSAEMAAGDLND